MKTNLENYKDIVGNKVIDKIIQESEELRGKHILHINSTYNGGGVAEILNSLVPLMNSIGIDTGWRILHGNPEFFTVTKKFHNALQGGKIDISEIKKIFIETNERFSEYTHINHDLVIIHDPQPLPLINFYKKKQPWIWRCHVDLSNPNPNLWNFIKNFIMKYNAVILSNEQYKKDDLSIEQRIIYPAIDPLSTKNMNVSEKIISEMLEKFKIKTDKPIITQISRFDKWKDPLGVIEVFRNVKKSVDCRLILCGDHASDDPESGAMYSMVKEKAKDLIESGDVILITEENNLLVNVLQRISDIIIQKSLKEGFGLTVTEAMWKERPVVASNVGGIKLQIKNGENGFLIDPSDKKGFSDVIIRILNHPELAKKIGRNAKENVRENFLITRLLMDHMKLANDFLSR